MSPEGFTSGGTPNDDGYASSHAGVNTRVTDDAACSTAHVAHVGAANVVAVDIVNVVGVIVVVIVIEFLGAWSCCCSC